MAGFEYDLVITNGICVTAADVAAYDVAIKDEKIVLLAPSGSLSGANAGQVIDAEGGYVTVRLIHLRLTEQHAYHEDSPEA